MTTVLLQVASVDAPLPTGVVAGLLRLVLTSFDGSFSQTQDVNGDSATFLSVPDGQYTATAQALDSSGGNLGAPVSQNFEISSPPPQTFKQPQTITITLS